MGILDQNRDDLRRPGVEETFAAALERCMSGDELGDELGEATTDAKKVPYYVEFYLIIFVMMYYTTRRII